MTSNYKSRFARRLAKSVLQSSVKSIRGQNKRGNDDDWLTYAQSENLTIVSGSQNCQVDSLPRSATITIGCEFQKESVDGRYQTVFGGGLRTTL